MANQGQDFHLRVSMRIIPKAFCKKFKDTPLNVGVLNQAKNYLMVVGSWGEKHEGEKEQSFIRFFRSSLN